MANAPVHAPDATSAKNRCRCSELPTSRTTGTNCVTVASSGPGATARPSSSATTAVSTKESPTPLSSSDMASGGPVETHHRVPEIRRRLPALYDRADDRQGAFLFEKGAHGVTQLLLVAREFELHTNPFLPSRPATGRVKPAASVADDRLRPWCYRLFRTVSWDERLRGPRRIAGPSAGASDRRSRGDRHHCSPFPDRDASRRARSHRIGSGRPPRPSDRVPADAPTLSGAPLAQRQSNGLLIRRFRVQIPRGAPESPAQSVARGALRCIGTTRATI